MVVPMEKRSKDEGDLYYPGDIAIEGSFIRHVGRTGTTSADFRPDRVINGRGLVVLPGLINSHTHAAMTLLRSYADDLPLMQWLEEKIWPLEARLTSEDVYWGTKLAILEMLRAGITAFADMYFFMEDVARAVEESGIRASLSRGLIGVGDQAEKGLEESIDLIEKWHNQAQGRIKVMLGPHAPYTCPPTYLEKVLKMAEQYHVGLHIHLAETEEEVQSIVATYGKRPVELMMEIGLFQQRVLAAHCVHLNQKEIEILADSRVGVVHNPESNMKLASGIAPVPEMLQAGIDVALGTDGAASNNNLDLFGEMRSAALLHKVNKMDPTVLNSYQTLEMATRNGAQVLGLEQSGILKEGYKADIILVNFSRPHLYPVHDVPAHLVYAAQAGDVQTVIIDGQVVVDQGRVLTMDEEEIFAQVEKRARRLTG
ncbi:MAG TPA: amidohydrolase [Clostridia bacterium]|nr:amidohydrolase [Clostridia bacterium]